MSTEIAELASAGAAALIGLMASDLWDHLKHDLARLVGRATGKQRAAELLETSRNQAAAARAASDEASLAMIQAQWRSRLADWLRSDPAAADDLRRLLIHPAAPPVIAVRNVSRGDVRFGSVVQAGQISGAVYQVITESGDASQPGSRTEPDASP